MKETLAQKLKKALQRIVELEKELKKWQYLYTKLAESIGGIRVVPCPNPLISPNPQEQPKPLPHPDPYRPTAYATPFLGGTYMYAAPQFGCGDPQYGYWVTGIWDLSKPPKGNEP